MNGRPRHVKDLIAECNKDKHDEALGHLGPRDVDLMPFRVACAELFDTLMKLGTNTADWEAEQSRVDLMNSLKGMLKDTDCDQTMISSY